ncbi:unnamed protein product [Phytophthora fragariaefolia]|uniref:Unnamed protein product n=1 Tax=Phytophthora fragariaefolia TaxID=1490495 RepID=A0A9W7DA97_9STRA|nr:unnamed protein product [Phytophthora fragariaefolia]
MHDDDDTDDVPGFSGMSLEAIEAAVDKQVQKLSTFPSDANNWSVADYEDEEDNENDSESTSEGFVSHMPEYRQTLVGKKIRLLEKQLQHRDRMLQTLQVAHTQAQTAITNLQNELELAQKELATAQEEWEEEKETILRFRGGTGGNGTMMQLKLGLGAAGGARNGSRMMEAEAQRQREMRQQMLNGAADAQEMLEADLGDGTNRVAVRGIRLKWKKFQLFLRRRLYPFTTDIWQIEAQFGSSVSSYFRFFGWIIMTFMVMSLPCFVFLVLHILYLLHQVGLSVAFIFYMTIQAASWYLIILLTTQSSQLQLQLASKAAILAPYASSVVPAVVTIINAILPKLISLLTTIEKWDNVGFAIKAMVTRLYLAKILNVLIQLFSFALLLDPLLLTSTQNILELFTFDGSTVRKNVMLEFKPESFDCRAEQASVGLLTLVVTDFSVSKVMAISSPLVGVMINKLKAVWRRYREKRAIVKKDQPRAKIAPQETVLPAELHNNGATVPNNADWVPDLTSVVAEEDSKSPETVSVPPQSLLTKSEFLVPQKMVALLYSCTIALVAIPLAPTTALLLLLLHVVNFKFDKFILMVRIATGCVVIASH